MFALEIDFHDGVSSSETLLVRRPQALIGTSEYAHVVIEGAKANLAELRVFRRLGDEFFCHTSARNSIGEEQIISQEIHKRFAKVEFGEVTTTLTALDLDLSFVENESPDSAGIRVLREALSKPSPYLPAVVLQGLNKVVLSFPDEMKLIAGRSRKCLLRLDSPDVSSEHAMIGYSNGEFWVEDLGSTNGTFLDGEIVSGRASFKSGQRVRLAGETILTCVSTIQEMSLVEGPSGFSESKIDQQIGTYPCLITSSDIIKPNMFPLIQGRTFKFGRDPINDVWVGASHISRNHSEITLDDEGVIYFTDTSSNGTFLGTERIPYGENIKVGAEKAEIFFGPELSVGICFNEDDKAYWESLWLKRGKEAVLQEEKDNMSGSAKVASSLEERGLKNSLEKEDTLKEKEILELTDSQKDKQLNHAAFRNEDLGQKDSLGEDSDLAKKAPQLKAESFKFDKSLNDNVSKNSEVVDSPIKEDVFNKEEVLSQELEPEGVFSKLAIRENLKNDNSKNDDNFVKSESDSINSSGQENTNSQNETKDELEKAIYGDSEMDPAFAGKYQAGGLSKLGSIGALLLLIIIVCFLFIWLVNELFA